MFFLFFVFLLVFGLCFVSVGFLFDLCGFLWVLVLFFLCFFFLEVFFCGFLLFLEVPVCGLLGVLIKQHLRSLWARYNIYIYLGRRIIAIYCLRFLGKVL